MIDELKRARTTIVLLYSYEHVLQCMRGIVRMLHVSIGRKVDKS